MCANIGNRTHRGDDGGCHIDLEVDVVADGLGAEVGVVACRILDAARARAQGIDVQADAVVVVDAAAHGVGEGDGVGARARGVVGQHGGAANVERHLRCASGGHGLAEGGGGGDHIARVEPAACAGT